MVVYNDLKEEKNRNSKGGIDMNEKVYPAGQYVTGDKKAKEEGRAGIGLGNDDWNVKTLER